MMMMIMMIIVTKCQNSKTPFAEESWLKHSGDFVTMRCNVYSNIYGEHCQHENYSQ